ncbi:MAG: hypothetical protein KDD47_02325, partial [Acidobacteria bacterium]|nr:hypothetical protein [Acidobacteriota bacterium]
MSSRPFLLSALVLLLGLGSSFAPAQAQLAELVADLNQFVTPFPEVVSIGGYAGPIMGGRLFFSARTPGTGWEVWTTDGSAKGTRMLGDFCPGRCPIDGPPHLVVVGERVLWRSPVDLFRGFDEFALWSSDGTDAGTEMLLGPQEAVLVPLVGAEIAGAFVFPTEDELWRTDGTRAGTVRLAVGTPTAREFTPVGSEILFLTGTDLWATDGTAAGTRQINDLPGLVLPQTLRNTGRRLFLTETTQGADRLWSSPPDGSSFQPVAGLNAEVRPHPGLPKVVGDEVFVTAFRQDTGEELWRTDGTA